MGRFLTAALVAIGVSAPQPGAAHPAPFSYVDVRIAPAAIDLTLVAHVYDLAHELGIEPMDRLLHPAEIQARRIELAGLLTERLRVMLDGRLLRPEPWSVSEALPERQSVRFRARYPVSNPAGVVGVSGVLFPYDRQHQTFINFYEDGELKAQAILSADATTYDHFTGTQQGTLAVVGRFLPAGIHHILIGPDHLLFLVGLLLLGGSLRQLVLVVSAFTAAHSITLSLAALNLFNPPAHVVEPAIALSIVYVGADNLMARGGRDLRAWIAFGFGFVHGFGFAGVLQEMALPAGAIAWSMVSFNLGVELGQLLVVVTVTSALAAVRSRSEIVVQQLAVAGSIVVMAAGTFWFIERVFFPGGMA
jgi:hydrogenase/urease accessory protein HupE